MDAISFVMGLRAQHLRSTNLSKLIYHGSSESSQAQFTNAYVKLVFETPERNHLEFKRQINSEGKSDYFIDDKVVTATEYDEKLESFGILSKAKNFLVFQGDVENIASKSPMDLTKLFEKVSKSDEFKKDYDRLKQKVDSTSEIMLQHFQKKKTANQEKTKFNAQKKEAEQYEKLSQEYADMQSEFVLWRLYQIEAKIKENLISQQKLESEMEEETDALQALNTSLGEMKKELAKAKAELIKLQNSNKKQQSEQRNIESQYDANNTNLAHCKANIQKIEKQIEDINKSNTEKKREVKRLEDEIQIAEQERDEKLKELEQRFREGGVQRKELEGDILEEYNQLKVEIGKRSINIQEELDTFQSIIKSLDEDEKQISNRIQLYEEKLSNLIKVSDSKNNRYERIKEIVEKKENELRELEAELRDINQSKISLEDEQMKKRQNLTKLRDDLRDARVEEDENEKDLRMNQALESMKSHFNGVYGKVSELFDISSNRFKIAVYVALGNRYRNAIVTDTESTAIECIKYLKEQRVPPMVFIPLDTIETPKIKEGYRNLHGTESKLVLDVITAKNFHYEPALRFVFGNTVLFRDMDTALGVINGHKEKIKAVTEDGTLFSKSGFITGGRREIADILDSHSNRKQHADISKLKENRDQVVQRLTEITQDMHKLEKQEQKVKTEIQNREISLKFMKTDLESVQKEHKEIQSEIATLQQDQKNAYIELSNIQTKKNKAEETVFEHTENLSKIESEILSSFNAKIGYNMREYEHERQGLRQEKNSIQLKYNQIIARLSESLEYSKSQIKEDVELTKLHVSLDKEKNNESKLNENAYTLNEKKLAIQQKTESLKENLTQAKENIQKHNDNINQALKKVQDLQNKQQSLQKKITNISNTSNLLRSKRSQLVAQCFLEEISLPQISDGTRPTKKSKTSRNDSSTSRILNSESFQVNITEEEDEDEVMEDIGSRKRVQREKLITIDFHSLDETYSYMANQEQYASIESDFKSKLERISKDMEKYAPVAKVSEKYDGAVEKFNKTSSELEKAKEDHNKALAKFEAIKEKRYSRFMEAFTPISQVIDNIYKELTKSEAVPLGGTAFLGLDQEDEPYLGGVKYNAMPPLKRYRDIDQLSGGERTVAALALLFAIHKYRPSPFFILDEVDAALDNVNVNKVAHYIQKASIKHDCQFIVVSLKDNFFAMGESLVGVMKDIDSQSSAILSLDLSPYASMPNGTNYDTDQESIHSYRSSEVSDI